MAIYLTEAKRNQLIAKSKAGDLYAVSTWGLPQTNRHARRKKQRLAASVKQYNSINMDTFFKDDILDVNIDVRGETDNYTVRISFNGILDELHKFVNASQDKKVDMRTISKSLSRAYNNNQVYVRCSCPDFHYRHGYWATQNGYIVGEPQNIPSKETNPNDTKGPGCKHIALALTDASWLVKVASVIHNYIRYMQDNQEQLYRDYIYPALYMEPYPVEEGEGIQTSMFDDDKLAGMDDAEILQKSQQAARERSNKNLIRFTKGNTYKFKKNQAEDGEQLELDLEPEITRNVDEIPEEEF